MSYDAFIEEALAKDTNMSRKALNELAFAEERENKKIEKALIVALAEAEAAYKTIECEKKIFDDCYIKVTNNYNFMFPPYTPESFSPTEKQVEEAKRAIKEVEDNTIPFYTRYNAASFFLEMRKSELTAHHYKCMYIELSRQAKNYEAEKAAEKTEAGKTEAEKTEAEKTEAEKTEAGKTAEKSEAEKTKAGKTEAGKTEAGKTEAGKIEAGKTEAGKTEAGKTEAGKTEAEKTEAEKTKAGKTEAEKAKKAKKTEKAKKAKKTKKAKKAQEAEKAKAEKIKKAEVALADAIIAFKKVYSKKCKLDKIILDIDGKTKFVPLTPSEEEMIKKVKKKKEEIFYEYTIAKWIIQKCYSQIDIEKGIDIEYAKQNIEDCLNIITIYNDFSMKLKETKKVNIPE